MERECAEQHHLCMESITTDEVFQAAEDLRARYGTEPPQKRAENLTPSDAAVPVLDFNTGTP